MMPQQSKHPGSRLIRHIQRRSGTAILFSGQLPAADEMPTAVPVSPDQPGNTARRNQLPASGLRTVTTTASGLHSARPGPSHRGPNAVQRVAMNSQTPAAQPAHRPTPQQPAPHNRLQRSGPVLANNNAQSYSPIPGASDVQRQMPPAGAPILRQPAPTPAQVSAHFASEAASPVPVQRRAAPVLHQPPAGAGSEPPPPATPHSAGFSLQRQAAPVLRQRAEQPAGPATGSADDAVSSPGDMVQRQADPGRVLPAHAAATHRHLADAGGVGPPAGQNSARTLQRQPYREAPATSSPVLGTPAAAAPAGPANLTNNNLQRQPASAPTGQMPAAGANSDLGTGADLLQRKGSSVSAESPLGGSSAPDTAPAGSATSERGAQLAVFRAESKEGLSKNWSGISADRQWEVLQRVKAIGEKYAQRREAEKAQEAAAAEAAPAQPERPTRLMRRSQVIEVGTSKGVPGSSIDVPGAAPAVQRQTEEAAPAHSTADVSAPVQRQPEAGPATQLAQRSGQDDSTVGGATNLHHQAGPGQAAQTAAPTGAVQRRAETFPPEGATAMAEAPVQRQAAATSQAAAQAEMGDTVQRDDAASTALQASNRPVPNTDTPGQPAIQRQENGADFVAQAPASIQRQANFPAASAASPPPINQAGSSPVQHLAGTTPLNQSDALPGSALQRRAETGAGARSAIDPTQAVQPQAVNSPLGPNPAPPTLQRAVAPANDIGSPSPIGTIQPALKQPTAAGGERLAPTDPLPAVQREMPAPAPATISPVQRQSALNGDQPPSAVSASVPERSVGPDALPGTRPGNTIVPAADPAIARAADPATLVEAVPPGGPTGSSIQFVPPTRPRPTAAQRQPIQRAPEAPTQSTAPDIPTEFGPLPADLWRHVGVEPPQTGPVSSPPQQLAQRAPLEEALFGEADLPAEPELGGVTMPANFVAEAAPGQSNGPDMMAGAAAAGTGRLTMTENEDSLQAPAPVILEPGEGQAAMDMFAEQPELENLAPAQSGGSDAGIPVFASPAEAEKVAADPVPVTLSDQASGASFTVFTDADRLDELGSGAEPENSDGVLAVYADEDQAAEMFANPVELFCQLPGEKGRFRVYADADLLDDLRLAADTLEEGGLLQAFASERDAADNFAAVSRILLKDETSQTVYFGFADREALADFLSTAEQHEAEYLVNGLARQVYQGLQRQFELERERRGGRLGR